MIKKSIIVLIVIVAIVGLAFATVNLKNTNTNSIPNTIQGESNLLTKNPSNNSTSHSTKTLTGGTPTMISPSEAQKIANTYINSSGAAAGTPKLDNQSGKLVYIVPVIDNGTNVGEIDIDAQTGQNLGGAGGVL